MNEKVKQKLSGRTLVLIKLVCVLFVLFLVIDSAQSHKLENKKKTKPEVSKKAKRPKPVNATSGLAKNGGNGFFDRFDETDAFPIFSIGKVINFFPVGDERECTPKKGVAIAKSGVCLNPYDCRQRDGRAAGDCAYGLGVCCVFEVSCSQTIQNNLTYFMSPGFPELWPGETDCNITLHKMHEGVTQLRVDFMHFNIGQPNRYTGECDSDVMTLNMDGTNMKICGQNHGQHMYYNFPPTTSSRDDDGDLTSSPTTLSIRAPLPGTPRLWLLRLTQLPLAHAAPHGCMQYFTTDNGTISTFNYASNGRHLADMTYRACVRRNTGICAVQYTPCHPRSFRIGTPANFPPVIDPAMAYAGVSGPAAASGPGTGFYGPQGSFVTASPPVVTGPADDAVNGTDADPSDVVESDSSEDDPVVEDVEEPTDTQVQNDDTIEGSGADPDYDSIVDEAPPPPPPRRPAATKKKKRKSRTWKRWSPYAQHYIKKNRDPHHYFGYGNYGQELFGYGRMRCTDRITVPCDNDNFISGGVVGPGVCDPHHCGGTFCPDTAPQDCRVETTVVPFAVAFNFGPPVKKNSPEDNIGACLRYQQVPCDA